MPSHDTTDPPSSGRSSGPNAGGYRPEGGPGGTDPLGSAPAPVEVAAEVEAEPPKSERPSMRPGGPNSLLGTIISGRYRIERLLGEGGMGAVYQAEHTHMRKRLAVKVLHPEMSRLPEVVARFEREAMAAAHIDHPNVATATDFGKLEDGSFFLVLEFVEGKSLRESIALGPLETGRAMRILRQTAAALQRAHALGIVHRDLKPENVMLIERDGDRDFVKVLDFGIAKVPVGELSRDEENKAGPAGQALTQLGMVYGTPEYMAPEQALGQSVTPSADIYALGVMMFEMLSGVRPFEHESKVTLLGMHVTAPIPSIAQKSPNVVVDPTVESVVRRMLAKESADRFKDAKDLIDTLDGIWIGDYGSLPGAAPGSLGGHRASMASSRELQREGSVPNPSEVAGGAPSAPRFGRGAGIKLEGAGAIVRRVVDAVTPLAQRLDALVKEKPKVALAAGAGAAALIAVFLVLVFTIGSSGKRAVTEKEDAAIELAEGDESTELDEPPKPELDIDAKVAEAYALVEKGDFGTGIDKLTALEQEHPGRADVHRALQKAYSATKNVKASMRQAELWLDADASAVNDLKLDEDVRNAAIGSEAQDAAFALLEKKMGTAGPDILYDIAYGRSGAEYPAAASSGARRRAKRSETSSPGRAKSATSARCSSCARTRRREGAGSRKRGIAGRACAPAGR